MSQSTEPMSQPTEVSEEILTDHNYDGILEYDNPTPGWWHLIWFGSIVWSILYLMVYHFAPIIPTPQEKHAMMTRDAQLRKYGEIAAIPLSDEKMLMLMNDEDWQADGAKLYTTWCASCHGAQGEGFQGPNMTDDHYKNIKKLTDFVDVIKYGAAGGLMPPQEQVLSDSKISVVAAYMASLRGKNLESSRPAEGEIIPPWPTASGSPTDSPADSTP